VAFKKINISELIKNYKEFYSFFEKSIDETLQIFGGNLNNREYHIVSRAQIYDD
jgi:hypothetical protein